MLPALLWYWCQLVPNSTYNSQHIKHKRAKERKKRKRVIAQNLSSLISRDSAASLKAMCHHSIALICKPNRECCRGLTARSVSEQRKETPGKGLVGWPTSLPDILVTDWRTLAKNTMKHLHALLLEWLTALILYKEEGFKTLRTDTLIMQVMSKSW